MKVTATVENAQLSSPGVWIAPMALPEFGESDVAVRSDLPSVLVIKDAAFVEESGTLSFDYKSAELLVRGSADRATVIFESRGTETGAAHTFESPECSEGDETFLRTLESMSPDIRMVGDELLRRIRALDPNGILEQRGRRFINRPDNFVALEPQTTINQIIVHVRGVVGTRLKKVATQRGYTAFKVSTEADLPEAGTVLRCATRKF